MDCGSEMLSWEGDGLDPHFAHLSDIVTDRGGYAHDMSATGFHSRVLSIELLFIKHPDGATCNAGRQFNGRIFM